MAEDKPAPGVSGYVPLRVRAEKALEELERIRATDSASTEAVILSARLLDTPGGPLYGKHPKPNNRGGIQFDWEDDISGGCYSVTVEFVGKEEDEQGGR